jgi:hypothetical protein
MKKDDQKFNSLVDTIVEGAIKPKIAEIQVAWPMLTEADINLSIGRLFNPQVIETVKILDAKVKRKVRTTTDALAKSIETIVPDHSEDDDNSMVPGQRIKLRNPKNWMLKFENDTPITTNSVKKGDMRQALAEKLRTRHVKPFIIDGTIEFDGKNFLKPSETTHYQGTAFGTLCNSISKIVGFKITAVDLNAKKKKSAVKN